jgi:type III secretion system TyeA family effector delivery regulator
MTSPPPPEVPRLDTTRLLSGLLTIVGASWVAASQFESLARELGLADGEPTIQFLTAVRGLLSKLPERVYQSDDLRRAVLTAAQDALDAAIDREEALDDAAPGAKELQ